MSHLHTMREQLLRGYHAVARTTEALQAIGEEGRITDFFTARRLARDLLKAGETMEEAEHWLRACDPEFLAEYENVLVPEDEIADAIR
ncbi:hypothetical protein [Belnapia moabensis]|uniref:hypothetical protein n=1 Tax=Belnapia moabensis TaxID=365533 RepID=UPI0005B76768|nr:hypothetical protein [Belnapia moabensis]